MCLRTSLSGLPDLASRTVAPSKRKHINIIVVPISSRAVDGKNHQDIYSLFLKGSGFIDLFFYRRMVK